MVSPSSITAWAYSPASPGGIDRSSAASSDARTAERPTSRVSRVQRAATRSALASIGMTRAPKAIAAIARAVYGPTPGSVARVSAERGSSPLCCRTITRAAACSLRARA